MATTPTWSYILIRLLFRFALKTFYGTIVVENAHLIPPNGKACIVAANHTNSLTDALMLVISTASRRSMLRLTAKAQQFGRGTFTSWLIENAGTVPIQRKKENVDADNSAALRKLVEALGVGDAVCLFPEGMSRYHPTIAPLKTGVARLVSDTLSEHRDDPDFEVYIQPCSMTYMHRQHFRSDVLVTFHPPIKFTPKDNPELIAPVDFSRIRDLTSEIRDRLSEGTFDSPSWDLVRTSKLAARVYAPLGTQMTLGDYVRVIHTFLEAFKAKPETADLIQKLNLYHEHLLHYNLKDDRVRRGMIPLPQLVYRIFIRFAWACALFALAFPGFCLWVPVFITTYVAVRNFTKNGPVFDTWDEIAQYKLVYGFASGICVYALTVLFTLPFAYITIFAVPPLMWMSLRWLEDAISAFRAFMSLCRLLLAGDAVKDLSENRRHMYKDVMELAKEIGLPEDPEAYFVQSLDNKGSRSPSKGWRKDRREKGRVSNRWSGSFRYFSITRRRKRDWNEILRPYDEVTYPEDDSGIL